MKENWEKLVALLANIADLYSNILQLSRQKSAAIVAADLQQIEALTQKEELLIAKAGKLEAAREILMRQIASACGLETTGLTLSKLREAAGPDFASSFGKIAEDFDKIMCELTPVNQLNTELIQQALSYVSYNINLLSQNVAAPTYAPQGQSVERTGAFRLLDRKV